MILNNVPFSMVSSGGYMEEVVTMIMIQWYKTQNNLFYLNLIEFGLLKWAQGQIVGSRLHEKKVTSHIIYKTYLKCSITKDEYKLVDLKGKDIITRTIINNMENSTRRMLWGTTHLSPRSFEIIIMKIKSMLSPDFFQWAIVKNTEKSTGKYQQLWTYLGLKVFLNQ